MPADDARAVGLAKLVLDDATTPGERTAAARALARLVIDFAKNAPPPAPPASSAPSSAAAGARARVTVDVDAAFREAFDHFFGRRASGAVRRVVRVDFAPATHCRCGAALGADGRCRVSGLKPRKCQA